MPTQSCDLLQINDLAGQPRTNIESLAVSSTRFRDPNRTFPISDSGWAGRSTGCRGRGINACADTTRSTVSSAGNCVGIGANVLNCLPKSAQPGARAALAEIYNAEDREHTTKAVAKITDHVDVLLEFDNYPAEHWIHLRTTNPIESTFATVRLRQRVTKGPGSRAAGVAMAFKLIESAQTRWRMVNAPHLVALVRAGARFEKGKLVERPDESGGEQLVA